MMGLANSFAFDEMGRRAARPAEFSGNRHFEQIRFVGVALVEHRLSPYAEFVLLQFGCSQFAVDDDLPPVLCFDWQAVIEIGCGLSGKFKIEIGLLIKVISFAAGVGMVWIAVGDEIPAYAPTAEGFHGRAEIYQDIAIKIFDRFCR